MGKPEIQSWIASTNLQDEDRDADSSAFHFHWETAQSDWQMFMHYARRTLLSGKTKIRMKFLSDQLLPLAKHGDLSLSEILDIFQLLTLTYPRYVDGPSREAVEKVGEEMVRRDELRGTAEGAPGEMKLGVTEQIFGWLSNEVRRICKRSSLGSTAPANQYVLLSWCCGLYVVCNKCNSHFTTARTWEVLLDAISSLLDTLLDPGTNAKSALQRSAIVRTRAALRSRPESLSILMSSTLAKAKVDTVPASFLPLLGMTYDVMVRLKDVKTKEFLPMSDALKSEIIIFYASSVILSKVPVSPHASRSLHDFIQSSVSQSDFINTIFPAMEKATLRAPEIALPVISDFFLAYTHKLTPDAFRKIMTPILNSAKSANSVTRLHAVNAFHVVIERNGDASNFDIALAELLNPPKSGKSSGPDHRLALYAMLAFLAPSLSISSSFAETVPILLAKETNDAAVAVLVSALVPHLVFLLKNNHQVPRETLSVIVKDMASSKPALRRSLCSLAGSCLWEFYNAPSDAVRDFASSLLPAFEANLKNIASNPLNSAAGPLEGYIAIASMLGPLSQFSEFDSAISRNTIIQALAHTSPKPSFLLWDKVYQKLNSAEDETWLLRAVRATLSYAKSELSKNEQLRVQVGLIFIHLAIHSQNVNIRRLVIATLEAENAAAPQLVNRIIRDALSNFISRDKEKPVNGPGVESDDQVSSIQQGRLVLILSACASFDASMSSADKQCLIAELLLLAHHATICGKSRQTWIDLCQKANVDPRELVAAQLDKLLKIVLHASTSGQSNKMADASYRATTTLAFVAPAVIIPRLIAQIQDDLESEKINTLSETDIAIWNTSEGMTFIDVLSTKKNLALDKKGKNADIEKWEAELRSSLANKKTAAASQSLSKQDRALVEVQLKKESDIRKHVNLVKTNLQRGLAIIRSIVEAGIEELRAYMALLVGLLLNIAANRGSLLADKDIFETYLCLGNCCSERLDSLKTWLGVATLRSLNVAAVPEHIQAEPLNSLAIRVLYRLRSLSEQAPFDGATFAYASPLLTRVIMTGGVDLRAEDDPLEQVALALDIIKFHCGEFAGPAFPREQTMSDLIHIIRWHPQLGKDSASALVDLGQAIHSTATSEEIAVLLRSTLAQEVYVRNTALQCLQPFDLTELDWSPELWIACHDSDLHNARLARHVWDDNGLDIPEKFLFDLQQFLEHENVYVRSSCAISFAEAVEHWPQHIGDVVESLKDLYREKAKILAPEFDEYGILVSQSVDRSDPWPTRLALAQALETLAPLLSDNQVEHFFTFLVDDQALGDRHPDVRRGMLHAGSTAIDLHGKGQLQGLISMFERHLASTSHPNETGDHVKEAVVILFGRVARHMDVGDQRISAVVVRLVDALKTPSEQVQLAVSDCLAPLIRFMKPSVSKLTDDLFNELFNAPKYGERRGAAYGLAGVVRGLGISGIKSLDIIGRLRIAMDDKKRYEPRQGVMFAFETLAATLGRNFEPYVIELLPLLLASFGDAIPDVREATQDAARVIMANMSGYGVKLILPSLLSGLDEKQWRTKKGSIELLGTMAFCAPKQLSLSLPTVIPRLTGVLTDSHAQVRAAANKSLKQFGEVINNPEIQSLVPTLLKALVDPAKTPGALTSLLKTSFMHFIDSPSLALVIPIIERALKERSADTKRRAAQIVGNLASLTDSQDFIPYLTRLLPLVHIVLVDPVPEARATAAKSLGTLIERLGEEEFPDMVPGLLRTLKTDTSGVDRQGAAQGLSEVLAGLGMERLEALLPDIVSNAQSPRSTVREGFMSLLVYLPATFGTRFQPHLAKIITPILSGLSDSEEFVREAAMRAGRMIISNYSSRAIDLLLPELERGMFDSTWRIRHSSITLIGELLFKVSGISGKAEIEENEEVAEAVVAESSRRALVEILGKERRDQVLSALYLVRQDAVNVVRQSAIHIWKALVHNTPRTVRELLTELIGRIIYFLADRSVDCQETAARTMGELCRKFGERILGEIIPILRASSTSPDSRTREGVSLALSEIMENATDTQREDNDNDIIAMVRASLVDDEANVRAAGAHAFDILQEHLGVKAIDQTIPTLLEALRQPGASSGTALQALKEVMNVRANTVFPVLIPTLIATPITVFNARALASLVTVAGNALSKRLTVILGSLVKSLEDEEDGELKDAIDEAVRALLSSVSDAEGLNTLMLLLLGWAKADAPMRRVSSCLLFGIFCEESDLDDSLYRVDWIRQLVSLLDDRNDTVNAAALQAFDTFVKSIPKDELEPLVVPLRRTIEGTGSPGNFVPGFSLPKGVAPTVPIIIAGLTTGSNEQREQAAYAIGDLVERTEENAIKPFVVPFTGPLIRVATQAATYPPGVKAAILSALTTMLERIPAFVKPFFPQLQRTFVKSASDPTSLAVRSKAGYALGTLMKSQPRVDPLVTELIGGARTADETIAASLVVALAHVVKNAGMNVGDKSRVSCVELVTDAFKENHDEPYLQAIASLFASLSIFPDLLRPVANSHLLSGTPASVLASHMILAILSTGEDGNTSSPPNLFQQLDVVSSVTQKIQESAGNERPSISRPARDARDLMNALALRTK